MSAATEQRRLTTSMFTDMVGCNAMSRWSATNEITLAREIREWRSNSCESRLGYLEGRGSNLGIDATKTLPGEGFKRPWRPLIRMDATVVMEINTLFGKCKCACTRIRCRFHHGDLSDPGERGGLGGSVFAR